MPKPRRYRTSGNNWVMNPCPPITTVSGEFDYQPLIVTLEELQAKALENRPDLRAAVQGITAAGSQHELAKANGKVDVTGSGNYSHVNGISAFTFSVSIPLPIFDRNQGEIARTQLRHDPGAATADRRRGGRS